MPYCRDLTVLKKKHVLNYIVIYITRLLGTWQEMSSNHRDINQKVKYKRQIISGIPGNGNDISRIHCVVNDPIWTTYHVQNPWMM